MEQTKGTFVIELKEPYKVLECDSAFLDFMQISAEDLKKIFRG